jgi:hypothetical protein
VVFIPWQCGPVRILAPFYGRCPLFSLFVFSSIDLFLRDGRLWRILTNKEIYARVKKPTIIETIRLNRLRWFEHVQRMEENRIPKRIWEQQD